MKAFLMPLEVGLKSERGLLTVSYLAGVTPFMLSVVMSSSQIKFIKHLVAFGAMVGWAWLIVRWWSRRKADVRLKI